MTVAESLIINGIGLTTSKKYVSSYEQLKNVINQYIRKHIDDGNEVHQRLSNVIDVYCDNGLRYLIYRRN